MSTSTRRNTIRTVQRGESLRVAERLEVALVTQGRTSDEVVENLQKALALHLEGEDVAGFGLSGHWPIQLIYDMPGPMQP